MPRLLRGLAALCLFLPQLALTDTATLHQVLADAWDFEMRANPTWASQLGDRRFNHRWVDVTPEGQAERMAAREALLDRLADIDPRDLSAEDRTSLELAQRRYRDGIEAYGHRAWLMPMDHRGGVQTLDNLARRLRFQTAADFEDWLTRLSTLDALIDDTIDLMRQGIDAGITEPRVLMQRVPDQVRALLVDDPTQSSFYSPFTRPEAQVGGQRLADWQAQAQAHIGGRVLPAYRRLLDFLEGEYIPAARSSVGASDLPGGPAWYAFRVRNQTTTDMTADEIHALGLAEVARIRAEMDALIAETGFAGGFQAFMDFLRTDPRFYHDAPEALLQEYRAITRQIDPELVKLFGTLPRMPYGVIPIPEAIAPDTTTAYYARPAADGSRAGYYYVNLHRPETRPRWEMEVLSVHEGVPGHHLQISLAMELDGLPALRRYTGFTAFTEGWGLYSERLGYAMGLYTDPYSRFGQLTYDMWRAVRLVVDTGLHAKGWSRQQAIDYFMANAPKTELDVTNEVDRYIGMPGQALAYKIGQLTMLRLRDEAEVALGVAFDIRAFHDHLLGAGAVPMDVLEQRMDRWLAERVAELPAVPPGAQATR